MCPQSSIFRCQWKHKADIRIITEWFESVFFSIHLFVRASRKNFGKKLYYFWQWSYLYVTAVKVAETSQIIKSFSNLDDRTIKLIKVHCYQKVPKQKNLLRYPAKGCSETYRPGRGRVVTPLSQTHFLSVFVSVGTVLKTRCSLNTYRVVLEYDFLSYLAQFKKAFNYLYLKTPKQLALYRMICIWWYSGYILLWHPLFSYKIGTTNQIRRSYTNEQHCDMSVTEV